MDSNLLRFRNSQSRLGAMLLCIVALSAAAPLHNSAKSVLPSALPQATIGVPYSASLTVRDGAGPYSFSLSGVLPARFSLNSATGVISGTPVAAGTFYFNIIVKDPRGNRLVERFSLVVKSGSAHIALQISPTTASLKSGGTQRFAASLTGTSNTAVTWSATAGSISSSGLFTAPITQTASVVTVIASSQASSGTKASATVNVSPAAPDAPGVSVTVTPSATSVTAGGSVQFAASLTGTGNTAVTWSATAGSISSSGLFTAPVTQTASVVTVIASSQASSGIKASATVNVSPAAPSAPAVSVTVTPSAASVMAGGSVQFAASLTGTSNTAVNWSAALGTINQSGLYVAPSSPGTDTIRAVSQANTAKYATAVASIVSPQPPPVNPSSTGADNRYCAMGNMVTALSQDGPALPMQRCFNTDTANTPSPGTVGGAVSTLTALNAAYAATVCGGTIQIQAGSVITGPWTPNGKGCDDAHYITVESTGVSNANFPAEGTRMTPCWSNVASLPNRPAYPCSSPQTLTAQIVAPNSSSAVILNGTDHIRFIGIEFTRISTPHSFIYMLADLSSSGATQTNHIIFDRSWFHGINQDGHFPQTSATDTSTIRAIYLGQANYVGMIDSYFSDFYANGSVATTGNTDSQAITGGIGGVALSNWGVYKIVNNHLEGAAEGILMGGSIGPPLTPSGCTPLVNCNLDVPTDIEVRRNFFFKSLGWKSPTGAMTGWPVVKNGFEMKIGARALFEANVVYNTWPEAQVGYAWSIAPKNQSGGSPLVGTALTALTDDFTYRYNYAYNVSYGIGLYSTMDNGCTSCASQGANRVSIHDNLIDDLNVPSIYSQNEGDAQEYMANAGSPLSNISIQHNTITGAVRSFVEFAGSGTGLFNNWQWQNNIIANGAYGFANAQGSGGCSGSLSGALSLLNACMSTYSFDHNVVVSGTSSGWPTGNFFSTPANVDFVNFNNGNGGDYHLTSSSPYKNAGSDGYDLGADINTLTTETAGVAQ